MEGYDWQILIGSILPKGGLNNASAREEYLENTRRANAV